jgi:outer membrane protein assembly factor BamA
MRPSFQTALLLGLVLATLACRDAEAIEETEIEEDVAELLPQQPHDGIEEDNAVSRPWAILPEIGFGPDSGLLGGAKFTHRNLFDTGVTFDVEGNYSLKHYQGVSMSLEQPFLADGKFLAALRFRYRYNPQRDFFGLGNNEQGPEPASTNSFQDIGGSLTFGWRPVPELALNLSIGLRNVHIGPGERLAECGGEIPCPFTQVAFPDLPGVNGGTVNPISLSLVWNGRDDFVRPTHGWRAILKVMHNNKHLLGGFQFTRFIGDVGYLRSFFEDRLVAGFRLDGEWVQGPESQIPYWELAELGGDDTMRGFFPHRFVGKGRALLNLEMKFLITEFDFFDVWHIKLDGVIFGDGGRVFLNSTDAQEEFKLNSQIFGRIVSDFRYSYGGGVRFALGKALVARIDVGFSDEEKGLVYLGFGQTF